MADKRILKTLHIGVGGRGIWPVRLATPERGFTPAGLCDPSPAALETARKEGGVDAAACYTDLNAAFKNAAADCAIICAPSHLHVPLVKRCIEAGIDRVLVEKGMATCWEEASDLVRFVDEHKATVAVAQNYRYQDGPTKISGLLMSASDSPSIGDPFLVVYQELRVRPEPRNMTFPFASVWDMSCHHFDLLVSWLGPVESMEAQAWGPAWSAYEHPNNTSAHLVFRNGTHVHYLHAHDVSRYSLHVELHGPGGAAVWTKKALTVNSRPSTNWATTPVMEMALDDDFGETGVLKDFYRYAVDGIEPGISARHNLEVMALCQMMVLSVEEQRKVLRSELAVSGSPGIGRAALA